MIGNMMLTEMSDSQIGALVRTQAQLAGRQLKQKLKKDGPFTVIICVTDPTCKHNYNVVLGTLGDVL